MQDASVEPPKKIAATGKAIPSEEGCEDHAGQSATSKVTWSANKTAAGTSKTFASFGITKKGKVTLTTTGKAKKLDVKTDGEGTCQRRVPGVRRVGP